MPQSTIDIVRDGSAPLVTRCMVLGEGDNVRVAFLTDGPDGLPGLLSAVTLTRSQLTGLAGMIAAVLDSADLNATSVN